MAENNSTIDSTKTNFELLCDVEVFVGITSVLPLLEVV
jgi:hypothetical protein